MVIIEIIRSRYLGLPFFSIFGENTSSALTELGVKAGDTVAVMDWDSHRYLECFFAVPMIGAVPHTINVRLSPDQIQTSLTGREI